MNRFEVPVSRHPKAVILASLAVAMGLVTTLYLAAEAPPIALFKRSEFFGPKALTDEQWQHVVYLASNKDLRVRELAFVRINEEALDAGSITVEMPDGNDYVLKGGIMPSVGGNMICWSGQVQQVRAGAVGFAGSGHICTAGEYVSGEFFLGGKYFGLRDNVDHQILYEPMPDLDRRDWCPTPPAQS